MPCETRPRSDSEADRYWRHIETTTIPISQNLRELIRADLQQDWHFSRLETFRLHLRVNWKTDDDNLVLLENETGTVTPRNLLYFCNKATALYYLQTAQIDDAFGRKAIIPGMIFAMICREWLQYHDSKPNIEFGHYVANPIRVATGGPSDVQGIVQAHESLCKQSAELMVKARQENLRVALPRTAELDDYDIQPLYKAVILLVDRFDMDLEPDANDVFDLQQAIHRQSVLVVRTGIEVGLSSQISFDSLKGKTLPLERSDLGMHPNVEVVRTSLANGIRFILDIEMREFTACPQNVRACGSDRRLNPPSPTWAGKSEDASKYPDTWADALVEAGDMYGYDEDHRTWVSIRRVQAAMIGENFAELVLNPFYSKWKE